MLTPELWTRLKAARTVPVFFGFLVVSWGILEGVRIVQNTWELPTWVFPASLVLLGIGLVIILATAWVQALPSTTERERAGEVPGDWELAPRDLVDSLSNGAVPHLTWGRSILGGIVALGFMFTLAGVAVLFQGPLITHAQPEVTSEGGNKPVEPSDSTWCPEQG